MRRAVAMLLLGAAAGYWLGFRDARRGPDAVGARVGRIVHQIDPRAISEQRQREAELMRQRVHEQSAGGAIEP